jgi:hypothetical protein
MESMSDLDNKAGECIGFAILLVVFLSMFCLFMSGVDKEFNHIQVGSEKARNK